MDVMTRSTMKVDDDKMDEKRRWGNCQRKPWYNSHDLRVIGDKNFRVVHASQQVCFLISYSGISSDLDSGRNLCTHWKTQTECLLFSANFWCSLHYAVGENQVVLRHLIISFPKSWRVSEWANERTNEHGGAHERSKRCWSSCSDLTHCATLFSLPNTLVVSSCLNLLPEASCSVEKLPSLPNASSPPVTFMGMWSIPEYYSV